MKKILFITAVILAGLQVGAQQPSKKGGVKKQLLFADNFSAPLSHKYWAVEHYDQDINAASVKNGRLELDVSKGITVWLKKELSGNLLIEYDRAVIMAGGPNDRLGDCNQFWMATGPQLEAFARKGNFNEYDPLKLYYVGFGAHDNRVTRMRRYNGTTQREIAMPDLKDKAYLLQPNQKVHIQIWVQNGISTFMIDGKVFFTYKDPDPYTRGLFGFRSFRSHQWIDHFKVWRLK